MLRKIFKFKNLRLKYSNLVSSLCKNSFYLGISKGMSVPLLPPKIDKIYNHIFMIIFRLIGWLCIIMSLTSLISNFPSQLKLLIIIVGLLHSILFILISLLKLMYGIYTLIFNKEALTVKN